MNKKEKLSLVFDFISDYLLNEDDVNNTEAEVNNLENESNEKMGRAHDIMKKMDEIDNVDSKVKSELKEKMKNLRSSHHAALKINKEIVNEPLNEPLNESFKNRTGVTLDSEGKLTSVDVGPIKEYTTISEVMNKVNN